MERRGTQRIPVGMYVEQMATGGSHRYFASDLSERGLYMERPVSSYVRHSKQVQLEIPLPGEESAPVWVAGEVVYDCFDGLFHGTAVRFTAMGQRDRCRLEQFLRGRDEAASAA